MVESVHKLFNNSGLDANQVRAIGISYQMHGLVTLDAEGEVVRPAIIWCDSRAVEIGREAMEHLGAPYCMVLWIDRWIDRSIDR